MNYHILKARTLFVTLLFVSPLAAYIKPYCATPAYILPRSQGEHLERLQSGLVNFLTKSTTQDNYGSFSCTPIYSASANANNIAALLFGDFLQPDRLIRSAGSTANGTTDLYAHWLYQPNSSSNSFSVKPHIKNFMLEADLYIGLDKWMEGLFVRINTPFVYTSWDLGMHKERHSSGSLIDDGNIFLPSINDYFCGKKVMTFPGAKVQPLQYARLCSNARNKCGLADIHTDVGWKFLVDNHFHLGLYMRLVAPTGTRSRGHYVFNPVIGNGHHWEFGGGITSSYLLLHNEEKERRLGIYLDCTLTHMFKTKECRVFDLNYKPLSRYIAAAKLDGSTVTDIAPLANLTASTVYTHSKHHIDTVFWLNYTHQNMSYDLGYNFWLRSCEKISTPTKTCSSCLKKDSTWGITNFSHSIITTAHNSTIALQAPNDAAPTFLTTQDLDYQAAATKGKSHTIFGHIAYNWFDCENIPYLGCGGNAELAHYSGCKPQTCTYRAYACKPCCRITALSQWSLWVKGGFAF